MYTQGTQNFNLPLYQGTDKPAWTDTNEGYAAIDEATGNAVATVEGLDIRVATVESEISDPTTGIDAQLATVKEDVSTLSGDVGALSGTVSGLQSQIEDVRADCEDMITSNHEATATASKRYEVGNYFIYNDVLYKCTVQINQGDTIVPNTNCEATNVMTEMPSGGGGGAVIDDTTTSTASCWSSSKTNTEITTPHTGDVRFSSNKLQQYNGSTWVDIQIGGGAMPDLNYANPLFTFSSTALSYTATKDCYLLGSLVSGTTGPAITIDGHSVFDPRTSTGQAGAIIPCTKIKSGSTVAISLWTNNTQLSFYETL
jgi:hypothetical protein